MDQLCDFCLVFVMLSCVSVWERADLLNLVRDV